MYPKNFTFDSATIARARVVTLINPNLDVLRPENRAEMPLLARCIEDSFKARDHEGKLLLPNLQALSNQTIGIFSDYAGDVGGKYLTYSFVVCAFGSLELFKAKMSIFRKESGLGTKEIAFKEFDNGAVKRALPGYLALINNYISGLVFTLAVDKKISSLFGPDTPETRQRMHEALDSNGLRAIKTKVGEKLFRVTHSTAFLTALLGHEGQKIFWLTDNDAIAETPEKHRQLMQIFCLVLPLYTQKHFGLMGGSLPFKPRAFDYLDILSIADIAAGSVAQILSGIDTVGHDNAEIKEGGHHVLRWLCYDSLTLKKFNMVIKIDENGDAICGPIDLEAREPIRGELFIPAHLVR